MFLRLILIKILFALPLCAEFIEEFWLKKDEEKQIAFFIENTQKYLTFRWTLFKDEVLIIHAKYDNEPRQFTLNKSLNAFSIELSKISRAPNPNATIYFADFDKKLEQAKFRYYLFLNNNFSE